MSEKGQRYARKEKIEVSDTMYDVLTSPLLQKIYGTKDPGEIAVKIFEEHIREKIKQGDFENMPGNEKIYQAFGVRPEHKKKE